MPKWSRFFLFIFFLIAVGINGLLFYSAYEPPVSNPSLPSSFSHPITGESAESGVTVTNFMLTNSAEWINKNFVTYLFRENKSLPDIPPEVSASFPDTYTYIEAIPTFRGNEYRNQPCFGVLSATNLIMSVQWQVQTGESPVWGGGAGWTGQPAIIRWPPQIRRMMRLAPEFATNDAFVEVIYASLDGNIYFLDWDTGEPTRPPLRPGNPIKGSVSLDPRGYPLLYVGEGIPTLGNQSFRIYDLISQKQVFRLDGQDPIAPRGWYGFDSSAVVNRSTDTVFFGGENGLLYFIKLNSRLDFAKQTLFLNPVVYKYKYRHRNYAQYRYGIENSIAAYKSLIFFNDNQGIMQCLDLEKMRPLWVRENDDDSDASIVVEEKNNIPYLYTGCEVDRQGTSGYSTIRKINGYTGETVWLQHYPCRSFPQQNGGLLATPALGRLSLSNLIIFTFAHYRRYNEGLMVALDKSSGREIWRWEMPNYSWSSPVIVYNPQGKGFIIQCDSRGYIYLVEGLSGKIASRIKMPKDIQASPVFYRDSIVIAERGRNIYRIKIN